MNASLIVPALFFAAISLVIVVYVAGVVASAIGGGSPLAVLERLRFAKKQRFLTALEAGGQSEDEIITACRNAFYLAHVRYNSTLIESVTSHNIAALSRLVTLAQKRSARISNLPVVETLIATRFDLMKAEWDVRSTLRKLRGRKEKSNKGNTPEWAVAEFSKKLSDVGNKLESNRKALNAQIDELVAALRKAPDAAEITYH
ncbi:MAG: hypothetical protein J5J00_09655 [Deltaproteobacteria bacterium]|nr:hypothetical protein [Deltaproteobacteria bacterium]